MNICLSAGLRETGAAVEAFVEVTEAVVSEKARAEHDGIRGVVLFHLASETLRYYRVVEHPLKEVAVVVPRQLKAHGQHWIGRALSTDGGGHIESGDQVLVDDFANVHSRSSDRHGSGELQMKAVVTEHMSRITHQFDFLVDLLGALHKVSVQIQHARWLPFGFKQIVPGRTPAKPGGKRKQHPKGHLRAFIQRISGPPLEIFAGLVIERHGSIVD
mmetsp:Transcript_19243/g.36199  ORF Transcript_19243/g.36199 Transcript_19243/m.36199 type:complete len:216 (-) Transcript_19243:241-888(-)